LENTKKESNESSEDDVDDANSMRIQKHLHDSEIGKIMDELMLSQFQMEKLRSRLASKFVQYVHKADVYYSKIDKKELRLYSSSGTVVRCTEYLLTLRDLMRQT
jgi:hypothetical protein